jgi:hypothetical protein
LYVPESRSAARKKPQGDVGPPRKSMLSKDPLVKLHGESHVLFNERRASVRD